MKKLMFAAVAALLALTGNLYADTEIFALRIYKRICKEK